MTADIFSLEWLVACRRNRHQRLRAGVLVVLFFEAIVFILSSLDRMGLSAASAQNILIPRLEMFAHLLFWQQAIAICLFTPAMSAGSISDEKQRGTLDFLLLAPLSSADIILGKWLSLCSQVFALLCPGYLLLFSSLGILGGSFSLLAGIVGFHLLLIGILTAFGLLGSVIASTTTRAVLGVYLLLAAVAALIHALALPVVEIDFRDLTQIDLVRQLGPTGGFLLLITLLCLFAAILRLRPAHEAQRTTRLPTQLGRHRDTIGETPMRWKERNTGGWLTIPLWHTLPRWGKVLLVMLTTVCVALVDPRSEQWMMLMATAFFVLSGIWAAVRCAGAITSEREKQTWDNLLMTRMDAQQIIRGKLWGTLDAFRPYQLAYLPAALFAAWQAGWVALLYVGYLWLLGWLFMYFLAACGMDASARSSSTGQSILAALARAGESAGPAAVIIGLPAFSLFGCILCLFDWSFTTSALPTPEVALTGLVVIGTPIILAIFADTEYILQRIERDWPILKENPGARVQP